jgi:hypothetical protein
VTESSPQNKGPKLMMVMMLLLLMMMNECRCKQQSNTLADYDYDDVSQDRRPKLHELILFSDDDDDE